MGIETTVTCDLCTRVIEQEDYAIIEVTFEIDHNYESDLVDERKRQVLVCCQSCGRDLRKTIEETVAEIQSRWKGKTPER